MNGLRVVPQRTAVYVREIPFDKLRAGSRPAGEKRGTSGGRQERASPRIWSPPEVTLPRSPAGGSVLIESTLPTGSLIHDRPNLRQIKRRLRGNFLLNRPPA